MRHEGDRAMTNAGWFVLMVVGLLVYLVFYFWTIQSILNSRYADETKWLWIAAVVVFQFFGPVAWHLVRHAPADRTPPAT